MSTSGVKVLVSGSVEGQFSDFFEKIAATNSKHGPFDVLLCTGNFFATDAASSSSLDDLVSGKVTVPLTTYFIQGGSAIPMIAQERINSNDGEICENLYFLGKKGTMTTAQGLKIAFLSGIDDKHQAPDGVGSPAPSYYSKADIDTLKNTKMPLTAPAGVDVLLTTEWPKGIENNSAKAPSSLNTADCFSLAIAELALALKPRYHFADAANLFYEREPYKNTTGFGGSDERPASHVSRFIGLGKVLNKNKQRWFYAYNIVPMGKATPDVLGAIPPLTTDTPFLELTNKSSAGQKRGAPDDNSGFFWGDQPKPNKRPVPDNYLCKRCHIPGHFLKDCPNEEAMPPGYICNKCKTPGHLIRNCPMVGKPDLASCWFCLANPKIEKHLITSIGSEVYATLAKGPLVSSKTSAVPGGGHTLLISIEHHPTFQQIPAENIHAVKSDLDNYKKSLRELFAAHGQDAVIFEVSRVSTRSHSHAHIQVVPIPKELSSNVETVARQEAEAEGYTFVDEAPEGSSFFDLELPNGKHLVYVITPAKPFNLQFGRTVLAKALGQPDRGDWRLCAQTEEEERQSANEFKEAFKNYDANSS